jgi:hypothetical protein
VATLPWTVGMPADRSDAQITVTAQVNTNQDPAIAYLYLDESTPVDVLLYSSMADTPMGTEHHALLPARGQRIRRAVDAPGRRAADPERVVRGIVPPPRQLPQGRRRLFRAAALDRSPGLGGPGRTPGLCLLARNASLDASTMGVARAMTVVAFPTLAM